MTLQLSKPQITNAAQVRFRKFSPIDRESPIYEVLFEEKIILDVARRDGDDLMSEFNLAFYKEAAEVYISTTALKEIVSRAEDLIASDEAE